MIKTIATAATCAAVGALSAIAIIYTFDHDATIAPEVSTLVPLTTEQIDIMTEGDDWDRDWESCRMNTDYWITCPDGAWIEFPLP